MSVDDSNPRKFSSDEDLIKLLDDFIEKLEEFNNYLKSEDIDPDEFKKKWFEFSKLARDATGGLINDQTIFGDSSITLNTLEEAIHTFFNNIWVNYEEKNLPILNFINKDDGFFYLNLFQSMVTTIESIIALPKIIDSELFFLLYSVLLHLYQHNFESLCIFLKPFVEEYLMQFQEDGEQENTLIYDDFLYLLESNISTIINEKIDKKLRNAIAHCFYTINMNDASITIKYFIKKRIKNRYIKTSQIKNYTIEKFRQKFFDLFYICMIFYKVWNSYSLDFWDNVIDKIEEEQGFNQIDIPLFDKSFIFEYLIIFYKEMKNCLVKNIQEKRITFDSPQEILGFYTLFNLLNIFFKKKRIINVRTIASSKCNEIIEKNNEVFQEGIKLLKSGKYEEAIENFDKILKIGPATEAGWINKGLCLIGLKKIQDAIKNYDIALRFNPNFNLILYHKAFALIQLEKYDDAIPYLKKSIRTNPKFANAYYDLACIESIRKNKEISLGLLEKAIKLDSGYKKKANNDKDFDDIRDSLEFKELVGNES